MKEIVIIAGPPGGGKTTTVKKFVDQGYIRINRDEIGGSIHGIVLAEVRKAFAAGATKIVLDNVYATVEGRASIISLAEQEGAVIHAKWMLTTPEQAQFFAARRQILRYGKLFSGADYKAHKKDPNMFPPAAQFAYWKMVEKATLVEGFASVEDVPVKIELGPEYVNKALILDYDGTLRICKSGAKYPVDDRDIEILPRRKEVLAAKKAEGWLLLGASNQSGCARDPQEEGYLSEATARLCFDETNRLLGQDIDYLFAPDKAGVPYTYWRKPQPGMGVVFIEKYKLDPAKCIMVGDFKSDKTFAARCGFKYEEANEFFK